ncbi:FAD binding domain-containing protein, partial [Thermovenabulum sp.]
MNFDYIKPNTLTDALEYLEKENAMVLAGGTDVVVNLKSGKINPSFLIDIKGLKELKGIEKIDGGIFIGALTTVDEIKNSPLLSRYRALVEGAGVLGCLEIRYRATIGGNICNGSPSADTVPGLLVYNAKVEIISKNGSRIIPLENF